LLNSHRVEYLLVGGYAVCFHGYYRNTADIDFWIAVSPRNAKKMVELIREFGFNTPQLNEQIFLEEGRIIRMGIEPVRIEVITAISGCNFAECYIKRIDSEMDGVPVSVIGRDDLIKNKLKAGRLKDLQDVQKLT
jgi:predicted nucleotidyltransferase